MVGRWG